MLISIVLLAFLSLGAVSAFDNSNDTIGNNIALDGSDEMLNADESADGCPVLSDGGVLHPGGPRRPDGDFG